MKIEPGHGVAFLLRNTKGDASYGSATVRKLTGQGVSIADVQAPQRLTGVTPAWVFAPNIVCFTPSAGRAHTLAVTLNDFDRYEAEEIEEKRAAYEVHRQRAINQFQLSEKED